MATELRQPWAEAPPSSHQDIEGEPHGQHALANGVPPITISKTLAARLYISHFLSTWNSRLFEAGVVYFLASIFPNDLLPISIYALTRNAAAIALTVPVGTWIDTANRLTIVRTSIVGQRIAVVGSCAIFSVLLETSVKDERAVNGLFACTVVLACVEKLCAVMNLVSIERDWVVVITEGDEPARRIMNARMRRIDLICKLVGPLTISLVAAGSVPIAAYTTLAMNLASVVLEYVFIGTVCIHLRTNTGRSSCIPGLQEGPDSETSHQTARNDRIREHQQTAVASWLACGLAMGEGNCVAGLYDTIATTLLRPPSFHTIVLPLPHISHRASFLRTDAHISPRIKPESLASWYHPWCVHRI